MCTATTHHITECCRRPRWRVRRGRRSWLRLSPPRSAARSSSPRSRALAALPPSPAPPRRSPCARSVGASPPAARWPGRHDRAGRLCQLSGALCCQLSGADRFTDRHELQELQRGGLERRRADGPTDDASIACHREDHVVGVAALVVAEASAHPHRRVQSLLAQRGVGLRETR
jgi:hypothetical protein